MFSFLLKRNVIVGLDWMRIKRDIIQVYLRVLFFLDKTSFLVAFVQSFGEASDDTKKEGTTNKKRRGCCVSRANN